jgi:hypothetical protein
MCSIKRCRVFILNKNKLGEEISKLFSVRFSFMAVLTRRVPQRFSKADEVFCGILCEMKVFESSNPQKVFLKAETVAAFIKDFWPVILIVS